MNPLILQRRTCLALLTLTTVLAFGCSDEEPSEPAGAGGTGVASGTGGTAGSTGGAPGTGGASAGGAVTGGVSATGGNPAAGAGPIGGAPTGGSPSGGSPAGGSPAGGSPTGGSPAGGSPAGGSPAGGSPTGGSPAGGSPAGGSSTGGTGTGGAGSSGLEAGGGPPAPEGGWRLYWHDEFEGNELDESLWSYSLRTTEDVTAYGFSPKTYFTRDNVAVADGAVQVRGVVEPQGGQPWSGALISTVERLDGLYGFIECRAKIPAGRGYWPAIWMVAADGSWPPEIDIMEAHGSSPWLVYQTYHTYGAPGEGMAGEQYRAYFPLLDGSDGSWDNPEYETTIGWSEDFHVYSVYWYPERLTYYIDGVEIANYDDGDRDGATYSRPEYITAKAMHFVLDMKLGGWGPEPDATSPPEASMVVDWVRWWQKP